MDVVFEPIPTLGIVKAHLVINCVLVFFAVLVVAARIWARHRSGAELWWDDYLVIIALLLVSYELIFAVCISTVKLSMMLFYLRVFVNRGLRLATQCAMAFVGTWTVGNILQVFLICRPFRSTYDPTVAGTCGNQVASFIAIGVFNVVTDVLILSLPMSTVWSLKMRTPVKIGITVVFLFGLLTSVVAIIRIVALTKLDLTNITGTMVDADFWSTFEINIAIVCVCLPMLGPLWAGCTARLKTSQGGTGGTPSGYGTGSKQFHRLEGGSGVEGGGTSSNGAGVSYQMNHLYASNRDVEYQVGAGKHHDAADTKEDGGSLSGSETALAPDPPLPSKSIKVSTKWTVSSQRI
ncbi:hypothetical protein MKZ38_003647 [Zalerion maritima]|uniref:Rhodopsin domain-containing protein n=1 Tax=Zalerion maritima TaxID=339359 RepID=A0AAD5RNW9_9PEZI|nr:hypothetical protein MKZ38_003647 [Zalerion maritima]